MTRKRMVSNGVSASAIAALLTLIGGSAAWADAFCEQYAARAVEHNAQARALNCGWSGRNWNDNRKRHHDFCVNEGHREAQIHERGRAQALKKCAANAKKGGTDTKKGSIGTWKGSTDKAEADACSRFFYSRVEATFKEITRLCAVVPPAYDWTYLVNVSLNCPNKPSQTKKNLERIHADMRSYKRNCIRR